MQNHTVSTILVFTLLFVVLPIRTFGDLAGASVQFGPWARDLPVGPGMDARGSQLKGTTFVGQDLRGAVFDGCDLAGVRFYQCDLRNASFVNTVMAGMIFGDCKIDGAIFNNALINNVKRTHADDTVSHDMYLTEAQLKSTKSYRTKNLRNCVIRGFSVGVDVSGVPVYDFSDADLRGATLAYGDFTASTFKQAKIVSVYFKSCKLNPDQIMETSTFAREDVFGICFNFNTESRQIDFSNKQFYDVKFYSPLEFASFRGAGISNCDFGYGISIAQLSQTQSYQNGHLLNIGFFHSDFTKCRFDGQNLTGSRFLDCNLANASFENAVISDVQFGGGIFKESTGLTMKQIQSTWNYRNRRMETVKLPTYLEHMSESSQ